MQVLWHRLDKRENIELIIEYQGELILTFKDFFYYSCVQCEFICHIEKLSNYQENIFSNFSKKA